VVAKQREPLEPLPDADPGLMAVLTEALDLDPAARPTAAGLRDRLAALQLEPTPLAGADETPVGTGADAGTAASAEAGRRRTLVLPLVGLLLATLLVAGLLLLDRAPGTAAPAVTPAAPPASSGSPSPVAPSSTTAGPTPTAEVPAGYTDCAAELGQAGYCPDELECWSGIISVFDLPSLGTPRGCDETHVYQTYAAGPLTVEVRRQSQLEELATVERLCSQEALDGLLTAEDRDTDWEVLALPPQESDGSTRFFRCIFGLGERDAPVELTTG
jgi:hypothetical protein